MQRGTVPEALSNDIESKVKTLLTLCREAILLGERYKEAAPAIEAETPDVFHSGKQLRSFTDEDYLVVGMFRRRKDEVTGLTGVAANAQRALKVLTGEDGPLPYSVFDLIDPQGRLFTRSGEIPSALAKRVESLKRLGEKNSNDLTKIEEYTESLLTVRQLKVDLQQAFRFADEQQYEKLAAKIQQERKMLLRIGIPKPRPNETEPRVVQAYPLLLEVLEKAQSVNDLNSAQSAARSLSTPLVEGATALEFLTRERSSLWTSYSTLAYFYMKRRSDVPSPNLEDISSILDVIPQELLECIREEFQDIGREHLPSFNELWMQGFRAGSVELYDCSPEVRVFLFSKNPRSRSVSEYKWRASVLRDAIHAVFQELQKRGSSFHVPEVPKPPLPLADVVPRDILQGFLQPTSMHSQRDAAE